MGEIIEKLRKFDGYDGEVWDDTHEEIDELLYNAKEVHTEFEDGGRWSNYETTVYEVYDDGDTAYFSVVRERPASEKQEGMDLSLQFNEVVPKQVTTTIYV